MKLLIGVDLHDDYNSLTAFTQFARENEHDLMLLLGDLTGTAIEPSEVKGFNELRTKVANFLGYEVERRNKLYNLDLSYCESVRSFPIVAKELRKRNSTPGFLKRNLEDYVKAIDQVYSRMDRKYETIRRAVDGFNCLTVPGNHDCKLDNTAMSDINMHLKCKEINGLKIAGYGGAASLDYDNPATVSYGILMFSPMFPIEICAPFEERIERSIAGQIDRLVSEPADFFRKKKPDIVLLHNPLYSIGDLIPARDEEGKPVLDEKGNPVAQPTGSKALLEYAREGTSKLFVSGHIHENPLMASERADTDEITFFTVMNPSALGETDKRKKIQLGESPLNQNAIVRPSVMDDVWGGRFMEVEVDDEGNFVSGKAYQLINPKNPRDVYVIASYYKDNNEIKEIKLAIENF